MKSAVPQDAMEHEPHRFILNSSVSYFLKPQKPAVARFFGRFSELLLISILVLKQSRKKYFVSAYWL